MRGWKREWEIGKRGIREPGYLPRLFEIDSTRESGCCAAGRVMVEYSRRIELW
jgi:hypothetical protein